HCNRASLREQPANQDVWVEVCSDCHGLWMDRGQIYEFSDKPAVLAAQLEGGLRDRQPCDRLCPRCNCALERGRLPEQDTSVDSCPSCGALGFESKARDRWQRAIAKIELPPPEPEPEHRREVVAENDPMLRSAAHDRMHQLAAGLMALPNL